MMGKTMEERREARITVGKEEKMDERVEEETEEG